MFDHFETDITCEEVFHDEFEDLAFAIGATDVIWPDPPDPLIDDEDDWLTDDDPPVLIDTIGLTGAGYALLAEQDQAGEFV